MSKSKKHRHFAVICCCITSLISFTPIASAQNLLQVFQDALFNDPTFRQAESQWEANKQQLPIALSALLPQIDAQANFNKSHIHENVNGVVVQSGSFNTSSYIFSLQQPVFNAPLWYQLRGANATVKADTAQYSSAFQNLIVRTTQAYINVLLAYETLRYTIADKKATYRQLIDAQQKFKVGLVAITEVYDAQSQYDTIVAQEIVARNTLDNNLEQLQAITSHYYLNLAGLGKDGVPLFPPKPADINAWVRVAQQQNYSILAQQYFTKAAYENIIANATNHLPTVTLQGSYEKQFNNNAPQFFNNTDPDDSTEKEETSTIGLSVNLPIYSGGAIVARTRQARYQYANAAATLELTHRQVVSQTRQSYLGVVSEISQIQADVQAIKSAANAVGSTEAGYKVGTRTMVDVLNDLTHLYQTQQQLAADQYSYITNFVALKNNAGTLSIEDIRKIDAWLAENVDFRGEYAPTRLRMENGTFRYTYNHHEIAEEEQGVAASQNISTLTTEEQKAYVKTDNTSDQIPTVTTPTPSSTTAQTPPAPKKQKLLKNIKNMKENQTQDTFSTRPSNNTP